MDTMDKPFSETIDNRKEPLPTIWSTRPTCTTSPTTSSASSRIKGSVTDKNSIQNKVLDVINQAKQMLVLCSFLLADKQVEDALLEAEKRGVRVYCLIASEARLDKEEPVGDFDKKVLAQHKSMLKNLGGTVMFRTSSNFHAKVVLADPFSLHANGVILTANITTDAMQRNEELLVELEDDETKQIAGYLKWALWEAAEHELIQSPDFSAVKPIGSIQHPAEPHPETPLSIIATTEKCRIIREKALSMIDSAQSEIQVSSFGWDAEHPVVRAIIEKAKLGIRVTVFSRQRQSSIPTLEALAKAGALVLGYKWLHAKALVVDNREAMVMSANFQKYGLDEGFELGITFNDDRVNDLLKILTTWQSRAKWQLQTGAKVGDIEGTILIANSNTETEQKIEPSLDLDLGEITSQSADDLQAPMPKIPPPGNTPYLAHTLNCKWQVKAPRLKKGSKQVFKPGISPADPKEKRVNQESKKLSYDPPIYKEPDGRRVVVINSHQQIDAAKKLKKQLNLVAIVVE